MPDDWEARDREAGALYRTYRLKRGWTQDDLAAAMRREGFHHWTQSTVTRSERGLRPLRYAEAFALADLLDIEEGNYWRRLQAPDSYGTQDKP